MDGKLRILPAVALAAIFSLPRALFVYGQDESAPQTGQSLGVPISVPAVATPLAPLSGAQDLSSDGLNLNGITAAGEIPALPIETLPSRFLEKTSAHAAQPVAANPDVLPAAASVQIPAAESNLPTALAPAEPAPQNKIAPHANGRAESGVPRKTLLHTLSAPMPSFSKFGEADAAANAAADFESRAQLSGVSNDAETAPTAPSGRIPTLGLNGSELIAAYQNGSLAKKGVAPDIVAGLQETALAVIREKLESARFKTEFVYGIFPTMIYSSPDLPGVIVKYYSRSPAEGFRSKAAAWKGYNLAKERLGGLFADTALVENVTLDVNGRKKRFPWVIVQERINTKDIAGWRGKALDTLDALRLRGVRDKDVGPRVGGRPVEYSLNMGETQDGRFVHFDADFFVPTAKAREGIARVPDPEPLRSAVAQAQRKYLESLFRRPEAGPAALAEAGRHLSADFEAGSKISAPESVGRLAQAGRNWYFRAIENDPAAVVELESRLARTPLPYGLLESEIAAEAKRHDVAISRIDSVYRYGSSVWGPRNNPPGDMDLLVIADGKASGHGKSEGDSLSAVDENDPASFLIHWNDEKEAPGRLPLNVTVISRKYIQNFTGPDNRPEGLDATVLGELSGDWGHGILVYGDDALASLAPSPLAIVRGAEMMQNNAGHFMENYIFGDDPGKPQAMSLPRAGAVSKEENAKLIPKMYLRLLEVRLRLAEALERAGQSPALLTDKAIGNPKAAFIRYFSGAAWPGLPKVDKKMVETTIGMHNGTSVLIARARKALMQPGEIKAQAWRQWLATGLGTLAVAGFFALLFLR